MALLLGAPVQGPGMDFLVLILNAKTSCLPWIPSVFPGRCAAVTVDKGRPCLQQPLINDYLLILLDFSSAYHTPVQEANIWEVFPALSCRSSVYSSVCEAVMLHDCRGLRHGWWLWCANWGPLYSMTTPFDRHSEHVSGAASHCPGRLLQPFCPLPSPLRTINRAHCLVMFSSLMLTFRMPRGRLYRGPCSLQHFIRCSGRLEGRGCLILCPHFSVRIWAVSKSRYWSHLLAFRSHFNQVLTLEPGQFLYCGFSWRTPYSAPSSFLSRTQGFIWFPSIPLPFAPPRFLVLARRYFNYLPLARHQRHTANSVLNSAASSGSCPGGRCCLGVPRLSAQEGARSPESLLTSLRCGI